MKIVLGNFNTKVGREEIFKPTIENGSLHEISNDNRVRLVNFATSKSLRVKRTMFSHPSIHKYTWTSPDGKTHNQIGHILIDGRRHSNVRTLKFNHTGQQIVILTISWWWRNKDHRYFIWRDSISRS
jgi:hypothetical protein